MANATVTEETTEQTAPVEEKRDYAMVSISVPHDLDEMLEKIAADNKVSKSTFVRRIVAASQKYDITAFEKSRRRGRVKYATEEERNAAQKERAATVKALMAKYNRGEISISDEEIAQAASEIKPRAAKSK